MEEEGGKALPRNELVPGQTRPRGSALGRGRNLGSIFPWAQHRPALPLGKAPHPFLSRG